MAYAGTEAEFIAACAACADAIAASNWSTARTQYAIAEALNAALAVESRQGSASMRHREALSGLKAALEDIPASVTRNTDNKRFLKTRTGFRQ